MTTSQLSVFVNGRHLLASAGTSLRLLLADFEPELYALLEAGTAKAVDARGLPADPDAPLVAGSIFRVARSARHAAEDLDA